MMTSQNIKIVELDFNCLSERWPCHHECTVTLNNGAMASCQDSFQIWSIISSLANDKITPMFVEPEKKWDVDKIKEHFQQYSVAKNGREARPINVVLDKIFNHPIRED